MVNFYENTLNKYLTGGFTVLLVFLEKLFGGHSLTMPLITLLTILFVLDWVSGITAAKRSKTFNSRYGLNGTIRTGFLYGVLLLGQQADVTFGTEPYIFIALWVFIALPTAYSMVANTVILEWDSHIKSDWIMKILNVAEKWAESEIENKLKRIEERKKVKVQVYKEGIVKENETDKTD